MLADYTPIQIKSVKKLISRLVLQDDITISHIYAPDNRAPKYVRQNLITLQGERDKSTITAGDFNTHLPVTERYSRQKISKDVTELNSTTNQVNRVDIYKKFHPTTAEHTLFLKNLPR